MEPQLSRRHSACDRPIRIIRSEHAIGRRLSSDSFRPWVDSRVFPQPARGRIKVRVRIPIARIAVQTLTNPYTCATVPPWQSSGASPHTPRSDHPRRHVALCHSNVAKCRSNVPQCRVHVTVEKPVPKLKVSKCRRLSRSAECSTPWKPQPGPWPPHPPLRVVG